MKYDKEEQKIITAFESGAMKLAKPSVKELEAIKRTAMKKKRKGLDNDKKNSQGKKSK